MTQPKYRIVSHCELTRRMCGLFTWEEAYRLICDWNSWHQAEDRARIVPDWEEE